MEELRHSFEQMKGTHELFGHDGPSLLYVDNCCQTSPFWKSMFPTLSVDNAGTTLLELPPKILYFTSKQAQSGEKQLDVILAPLILFLDKSEDTVFIGLDTEWVVNFTTTTPTLDAMPEETNCDDIGSAPAEQVASPTPSEEKEDELFFEEFPSMSTARLHELNLLKQQRSSLVSRSRSLSRGRSSTRQQTSASRRRSSPQSIREPPETSPSEPQPPPKAYKKGKVCLVQLAFSVPEPQVVLIQLKPNGRSESDFPSLLSKLLQHPKAHFVGNYIHFDVGHLNEDWNAKIHEDHWTALAPFCKERGWIPKAKIGLDALCRVFLNKRLDKSEDVRVSNWGTVLKPEQQEYAARDAWASLQVFIAASTRDVEPFTEARLQIPNTLNDPSVKLDAFHGINRPLKECAAQHPYLPPFAGDMHKAMFIWDPAIRDQVDTFLRMRQPNPTTFDDMLRTDEAYLLEVCPQIIPPPDILVPRLQKVFADYTNPEFKDHKGNPLMTPKVIDAFEKLLVHARKGCLSDRPGVALYFPNKKKNKDGLTTYWCARGTSKLEAGHQKYGKNSSWNMGPELTCSSLAVQRHRSVFSTYSRHLKTYPSLPPSFHKQAKHSS